MTIFIVGQLEILLIWLDVFPKRLHNNVSMSKFVIGVRKRGLLR